MIRQSLCGFGIVLAGGALRHRPKAFYKMSRRKTRAKRPRIYLGRNALPTWSHKTFMKVAADRGYATKRTICYQLSREMDVTPQSIDALLSSGKLKWEHILFLGQYFEMTPREFADCFLRGYFQENEQGRYVATFENPKMLLDRKRNVQTRKEVFGDNVLLSDPEETILW